MVVVGYYNKLPSGVSLPKHKSLFAIAYGATEAHPACYAKNRWKEAEAHWSTSATNAGTTRIFLAQPPCLLVETLEQMLPFDHQARPRDGVLTMYMCYVLKARAPK